jgi:hypothetical protein
MPRTRVPSDEEFRELMARVDVLERRLREMGQATEDPMFRSMMAGARRIPFGTRYTSPLNAKLGYVLRRAAGGGASFTAAPATSSSWSDA